VLSGGIGGGPNVVLARSLRAAGGIWTADPYPALAVGDVSLDEVFCRSRFVVFFAVLGGKDAQELQGGAFYYSTVL
jgi:hypothetical protein